MQNRGTPGRFLAPRQSRYDSILKGLLILGGLFIVGGSYEISEIDPSLLWGEEGAAAARDFLLGLFPPAHSWEFLGFVVKPALDTLYIAILGTLLGVLIAIPLSLLATASLVHRGIFAASESDSALKRLLRMAPFLAARGILNLLRSIPELVWALIFVRAVGLGPLPGVLALGVAYAGVLGKLYSEILDSVDPKPIEALHATGASKGQVVLYGYLPLALPDLVSYTLYRWECGIRAAVVLGFVGAGGIGQELELSMRMFDYQEVATLLIVLCLLVGMADMLSGWLRRKIL